MKTLSSWALAAFAAFIITFTAAPPVFADAPALQVSPLDYQDTLTPGHVKTGYVDVANPGDSPVEVQASVRGFRQTGTDGQLEFFDSPQLIAGITVGLPDFTVDPRGVIRIGFAVDPAKLPKGGVYAAIFFSTVPPAGLAAQSSYVSQSAGIGTLLELTNGPVGPRQGTVAGTNIPFWQLGSGLSGSLTYQNPATAQVGYRPNLNLRPLPWSKPFHLITGLVLPGVGRTFTFNRPGSYFGLVPLTVTDQDTHKSVLIWLFACTGYYQWLLLASLVLGLTLTFLAVTHRLHWLIKRWPFRRRHTLVKRPIDGLSFKAPAKATRKAKKPHSSSKNYAQDIDKNENF